MAQPKALFGGRDGSRTRGPSPWVPDRKPSPKSILCVLPRRLRANPLKPLLKGYDLTSADTWSAIQRLIRRDPHDLYLVYAPLGWAAAAEVCRRVRLFDQTTPLVVYSMRPSAGERQDVISGGGQAYVARSDDAHNIAGTAGQLIMLAELRSMEAMTAGASAMQENIVRRLARLDTHRNGAQIALQPKAHERLKIQTRRIFALAGGSPAHFERIWSSIYKSALERLTPTQG